MLWPFITVEGGAADWMFSHPATLQSPSLKRAHESSPLPPPVHKLGPTNEIHSFGRDDGGKTFAFRFPHIFYKVLFLSSLRTHIYTQLTAFFYSPENYNQSLLCLFSRCNALIGRDQTACYITVCMSHQFIL